MRRQERGVKMSGLKILTVYLSLYTLHQLHFELIGTEDREESASLVKE